MRLRRRQRRPSGDSHVVEGGHVWCPVRHADVNIERCFMCGAFEDLVEEDGSTFLYCVPGGSSDGLDWCRPTV